MPQEIPRWFVKKPAIAPAVGAELSIVADGVGPLLVKAMAFRLATSAVVGLRVPVLTADDGTDAYWRMPVATGQPGSSTVDYTATAGAMPGGGGGVTPTTTLGTDPPAGSEMSVTVPAGQTWRLEAVEVTLVTSAVVNNRQVALVIDDGVNEIARIVSGVVQAASTTVRYVFSGQVDESANRGGVQLEPLPTIDVGPGWRIRTVTTLLDVGDNYGPPTIAYDTVGTGAFGSLAFPYGGLVLPRGFRLRTATSALDVGDQYSNVAALVFEVPSDYAPRTILAPTTLMPMTGP